MHYEAEPFEMSAGKKVNTREQPETNFICLSCYIEEHLWRNFCSQIFP